MKNFGFPYYYNNDGTLERDLEILDPFNIVGNLTQPTLTLFGKTGVSGLVFYPESNMFPIIYKDSIFLTTNGVDYNDFYNSRKNAYAIYYIKQNIKYKFISFLEGKTHYCARPVKFFY